MEIVYLAQLFERESEYDSDRHYFHCKKLKEAGHQVTVLTSNVHYKTGKPKYKDKGFTPVKIKQKGLEIYYLYSPKNFVGNYPKRILYYISFFFFSLLMQKKLKKTDVIYAVSPSLTVGLLGYIMSKRLKARFILEIADVWPDVFIEMGYLKNRFIIYMLRKIELFCYRKAQNIVALTRGIKENIQAKIKDKEKVIFIPNGVNKKLFSFNKETKDEANRLKVHYDLNDKFICLYLGAHNLYNALDTIIQTAKLLRENPKIHFVLIGSGDKKTELQRKAERNGLDNITFFPPVPRKKAPVWYQTADVFLLPNLKGEFYKMNLQNKFFDYLASAKLVIFAGAGETAEIISKSGSGLVVEPENSQAVAEAVLKIKSMTPEQRDQMGQKGREFIMNHFDRNELYNKMLNLISPE